MTYKIETPEQLKATKEHIANFKQGLAYWQSNPEGQSKQRIQLGIDLNTSMIEDLEDQIKTYLETQPQVDYPYDPYE